MATISPKQNNHVICVDGTEIPIDNFCITKYNEPDLIDITTFGDLPSKVFITGTDEFCVEILINDYEIKNSYTINNITKGTMSICIWEGNGYKIIPNPLFIKLTYDGSKQTYVFNFLAQKIMISDTNTDYEKAKKLQNAVKNNFKSKVKNNFKSKKEILLEEIQKTDVVTQIFSKDENIAKNRWELMDL